MKIGIIVTARVRSSRLEKKVLQEINGVKTIEILLNHVINNHYPVILAIPDNKEDDILQEIAIKKGVEFFRGNNDSPLHRLYACAKENDFDHVARITADDILIDINLLLLQVDFHLNRGYPRDYTWLKRCPEGIAGEVISVSALKRIIDKVGDKPVEFVSYYLKKPEFTYKEWYPPKEYQKSYRLTMDYEDDLTLLRVIHTLLKDPGTLDITNLIKNNKYLLRINHLPKITLFIAAYNTDKYILKTIESIMNQTFKDFELIIIDDGSTDNVCKKVVTYCSKLKYHDQQKIRFVRNDENIGQSKTCNKALGMARGKYLMCVDSDDILLPTALETMLNVIEMNDSDVVMSGYERIDKDDKIIENSKVLTNEIHLGCALISTWVINELKFKENIRYEMGTEFLMRLKEDCKISYLKDVLWNYRKREGQLTQEKNHPQWNGQEG
jgi:spore coat polysaccharide biosynthesis protein SpsF (cytidylyltransferase family)